jgi:hypothetical protein
MIQCAIKRPLYGLPKRQVVTIIAGFRCQDGIVVCADTQETSGSAKRSVPKLQCFQGPVSSQDGQSLINPDLALAICGAGDGPFIDKITSQAWEAIQHVSDVWEASDRVELMIKETYKDFGQIFQPGSCPQVDLIYGIKIGGASRLFEAKGPVVNETNYSSDGAGYYLADFLTSRMRGDAWLNVRQTVILAAYILFQAKEHVEGCGGESHIAVLREGESSGMVDFRLIQHLTEYLKIADLYTGEMLLASSDFSLPEYKVLQGLIESTESIKFLRARQKKQLETDRRDDRIMLSSLIQVGEQKPTDDLGLPIIPRPSDSQTPRVPPGTAPPSPA